MDGKVKSPHPSGIPIPRHIRRSASQPIPPRLSRRDQFQGQEGKGHLSEVDSTSQGRSPSGKWLANTDKKHPQSSEGLGQVKVRKGKPSEGGFLQQSKSCDRLVTRQPREIAEAENENQ
ncbi:uncharacterized protein LOC134255384, partial [Saccostrea cucullata]|uniref:uncharacterized protein LOC134255384 n=1 Tax=Saccostrea cuccullata TaxID=36930 RepID=UPI002ED59CB1